MSNANGSPSPRAVAMSSSIVPVPMVEGSLSREDVNRAGADTQRVEESKENDHQSNAVNLNPESSIRNEPEIHGAFESVEQNLIAIESNNVERVESSLVDETMQAQRRDLQFREIPNIS